MSHPHILDGTFRAAPGFELVQFERLPALEQRALGDLCNDPEFFGVLRPKESGRDLKSVCGKTALLWHALQSPGPLPARLLEEDEPQANLAVARLVLDHILEIETPEGFVGGVAASHLLATPAPTQNDSFLARLSEAAVIYGQSLRIADPLILSARLYDFHRLPASAPVVDRLDRAAASSSLWRPALGPEWHATGNDFWRIWSRDRPASNLKIYLSPWPGALIEAFEDVVAILRRAPVAAFKVGADALNLLRPDKCVIYLALGAEVSDLVSALAPLTSSLPVHGVPFTAEAEPTGMLSWGIDPPHDAARLPWQGPSWRRWITDRLAVTLCATQASKRSWRFALDRLRLDGIDPATWAPLEKVRFATA